MWMKMAQMGMLRLPYDRNEMHSPLLYHVKPLLFFSFFQTIRKTDVFLAFKI